MSKEKAFLIATEVARVFQESLGISFEEAFDQAKKLYGVK